MPRDAAIFNQHGSNRTWTSASSLITLGVAELARSRRFYEHLGWRSPCPWGSDVVFFQANGMIFGLWSRDALDRDSCAEPGAHSGGFALAYNVGARSRSTLCCATQPRPAGP